MADFEHQLGGEMAKEWNTKSEKTNDQLYINIWAFWDHLYLCPVMTAF